MKTHLRHVRVVFLAAVVACGGAALSADGPDGRWSADQARRWYAGRPWPVGCNYIPSSAINQIETWQAESFDPATIDRELGWAEGLGFNTVRVFLHDLVWEADPAGFKERLRAFLALCEKHRLRVIVTFFTNGCYGFEGEPKLGRQPDPVPGVHNSGWVQSPGAARVNDPAAWPRLERYVRDVIGAFAQDDRVLMWCLYNEPESTRKGAQSLPLLRKVFEWARDVRPTQPLTAPMMQLPGKTEIGRFLTEHCDVISFHSYAGPEGVEKFVRMLKAFDRPIVCTEYMARPKGSTFQAILPIFERERIGAISFGLAAGKMNTIYPWGSPKGSPEPKVWFHDIFRPDGTPYDADEAVFIRRTTGRSAGAPPRGKGGKGK